MGIKEPARACEFYIRCNPKLQMHPNATNTNKGKVLYPELSYQITGLFFKVHNELGRYRIKN